MEKKRKIRFIVVWLLITAAFLAGSLLAPGHGKSESVQEAMRDAVLHGTNRISLFGLKDVNPAYISSLVVVGALLLAAILLRVFVIPRFKMVPGKLQMALETAVGLFDGMAKGNSPHRNKFLGAYIFGAGVYIFVGTLFELFGFQAITTGGHPKIESFKSLARLGHNIEPPVPSLFTFNIADKAFTALTGTVVNPVGVSITGTKLKAEGSLLITHWGMSGPAVLRLSSLAARQLHENNYQLNMAINWIQLSNRTIIEQDVNEIIATNPQKQLANVCPYGLPSRLWLYLIRKMGFPSNRKWNELGKKGRNLLIETLTNDQYRINGKGTFKEELVTCGGVSLSNIHQHTLESKVCPHLFLAGEVLDIDAVTGGFNLQAAWTTGYIVGQHIVE